MILKNYGHIFREKDAIKTTRLCQITQNDLFKQYILIVELFKSLENLCNES